MGGIGKRSFTYDYPRPSVTVDVALITREENPRILLIRRKHDPFAGCWALPGGFVDPNERLGDAARRELLEETGIVIENLEQLHTFGDPGRDPRGWTISVVFIAHVDHQTLTPRGSDDAEATDWFLLKQLPELAFDHAGIIERVRTRLADRSE